ncbi:MAG: glutamine amidotransferase [Planctomycetota bacterium]|nr:glutamine amidotransferase [Planctomycetota bacterium]
MNKHHILYCGDTSLDSAAAYLAGLMTLWNWDFTYISSDRRLGHENVPANCSLFIFSDYPAAQADAQLQNQIIEQVRSGAGLLMIGGWESYHGLGGNWDGTPIGNALPVEISQNDDRRNCDQPVFARPTATKHPVTDGLPWSTRPPLIGGFNRFSPRLDALTILEAVLFNAQFDGDTLRCQKQTAEPLLVVGREGAGRTAALATDVAPHWIGPMVDWGTERVTACAVGAGDVEVGNLYADFFRSVLSWTGQFA